MKDHESVPEYCKIKAQLCELKQHLPSDKANLDIDTRSDTYISSYTTQIDALL